MATPWGVRRSIPVWMPRPQTWVVGNGGEWKGPTGTNDSGRAVHGRRPDRDVLYVVDRDGNPSNIKPVELCRDCPGVYTESVPPNRGVRFRNCRRVDRPVTQHRKKVRLVVDHLTRVLKLLVPTVPMQRLVFPGF